jgi:hypothetical protein
MKEEEMTDRLEQLWKQLGKKTKELDNSENEAILSEINEVTEELKKIKPSTSGEGPDPTTILPHGELAGKKVATMKIQKRRRPGGNIEPMGL